MATSKRLIIIRKCLFKRLYVRQWPYDQNKVILLVHVYYIVNLLPFQMEFVRRKDRTWLFIYCNFTCCF